MARRNNNRRKRKIVGRGDYTITDPGSVTKAIHDVDRRLNAIERTTKSTAKTIQGQAAGVLGRAAGTLLGNGELGQQAGEGLAKWFGYGDYSLTRNSLLAPDAELGLKFSSDGKRGIRIMEREFLGDIYSGQLVSGSSSFTNEVYPINPGDPKTFPWLSRIASNFDQWKPNGIIFEFKSTSSTFNGASQALGVVVAATDYDVLDPAFSSKIEMETADYSNSCKASEDLLHGIECEAKERPDSVFFVRHSGATPDSLRFYDLGNFQVATKGMSTANVSLGELWVSYDITFYKKQLNMAPPTAGFQLRSTNSAHTNIAPNYTLSGGLELTVTVTVKDIEFFFPSHIRSGRYQVAVLGFWGGGQFTYGVTNCTTTPYGQEAVPAEASGTGGSPTMLDLIFEIDDAGASFLISHSAASWGPNEFVVYVQRVPDDLTLYLTV